MKDETSTISRNTERPKAYTIKYKRPRGSRACTVCRARKVRCDAEIHIPCTNCITFGCECFLPETKRKNGSSEGSAKKPAPNSTSSGDSMDVDDVNDMQNSTSRHMSEEGADSRHGHNPPLIATHGTSLQVTEPIHNISQVSVPPSLTSSYKTRPSMHKREMEALGKTSVTFMGHSSISLMAQKVGQNHLELAQDLFEYSDNLHLDSIELEILKMRGAFLLPSPDLAADLIKLYFEHVHPLMPVINRTEFMAKYQDPYDSPLLMLLQAVLLCGSRVSENPLLFDGKGLSNLASLTFFRRAKALYETNYESDPVSIIQTVLLIGSFWEGPEDVTRNSYYWTRVGVGLAQGFGFHRDISSSPMISFSEKKIWRRIWWCLFEKDRNVAIAFGRPATIDLADSDAPMLTLEDFNEDDPETGVKSPYPVNKTHALYFIHLVKLAEITGIIISHQYTVKAELMRRTNKFSVIQRCDMLMGIWFNNLPTELQFLLTDSSKQNFYACLLNAQYYNRLYLIHRANLLRMARSSSTNPNNYKYPSWGISFQAARMISIVSKILLDKKLLKFCPVMFVYILFSSLIMLIYHVDSTNPVIATTASDSLFISKGVLKEMGKYWQVVGVLLKLFDKYANDKIKRAQVIERGTIIAEMQERRSSQHYDDVRQMNAVHSSVRNNSHLVNPQPHNGPQMQSSTDTPDIEQLVFQYKRKLQEQENAENPDTAMQPSNSNTDTTPNSNHSFPDISLVTEKQAPANNFLENFEPAQLFPMALNSFPNSRAQSPFVMSNDIKGEGNLSDTPAAFQGGAFSRSGTNIASGDVLTNFVDSSYINMNFQSHVEDEGFLNDDLALLLNMH
ncbi:Zn(2)-Cys(6) binuclear cluster domain-containing protein [Metschnikowia aff. pulcherrima]|uniref:Zn(2)-Cys(6) binuclear cluster domain-containing protein n=1 Tax=Metschnikowia aff. pulcherrima TaxID=2163413 RepID=A0A4P6XY73_9ASCO|nr:Zn(2)-Cys(6) binuclear cluster domain-containing protein [Metschnikowia aff. pulcherrima]